MTRPALISRKIVSKQRVPLVQWQGPEAYIYGKPVKVCPGMDNIGASKSPVVFGDGAYWMARCVMDDMTYVQIGVRLSHARARSS